MPAGKLATSVRVTDEGGRHVVIAAGDEVPAWASKQIVNPKAWDGDDVPAWASKQIVNPKAWDGDDAPEAKTIDAGEDPASEGYESKTVADLRVEIKARNETRDDESRVSGVGNKADLIAALEADDGRA